MSPNNLTVMFGDFNVDSLVSSAKRALLSEVLSSHYKKKADVKVVSTGISDHTGLICELNIDIAIENPSPVTRHVVNTQGIENMRMHLAQQDWVQIRSDRCGL